MALMHVQAEAGPLKHLAHVRIFIVLLLLALAQHVACSFDTTAEQCESENFLELYSRIDHDLRHWHTSGISQSLMDGAFQTHTFRASQTNNAQKAFGILFENGMPYLLSNLSSIQMLGHHAGLLTAHLALFEAMGKLFGPLIPDVEFIVGTFDVPQIRLDGVPQGQTPIPILRFCSSVNHADIPVPDIHFQMKRYNKTLISKIPEVSTRYTWRDKQDVLFGRFSPYQRIIHETVPPLYRKGFNGTEICHRADDGYLFCSVRVHFMQWAEQQRLDKNFGIDVRRQPKVPMLNHAGYKYLLHLDGQSCSSRLEQLLVMGSVVLKEESGYHSFFHHLLKPHQHYLPVWSEGPEDVKQMLEWARAHDSQAQQIAERAQAFAAQYLHSDALMCYWVTLLKRLSRLLRYRPGRQHRKYNTIVPVSDYLSSEGKRWLKKYGLASMELPPLA